jgi:hypothetical protein
MKLDGFAKETEGYLGLLLPILVLMVGTTSFHKCFSLKGIRESTPFNPISWKD